MELDPFLALEHTSAPAPSTQPAAAVATDNVDPLASILEDEHENISAPPPPAAAKSVVIDRSEVEKPMAVKQPAADTGSSSAPEPIGQGEIH